MFPNFFAQDQSSYYQVEMGEYLFLSTIPSNLKGFISSNVCECVCGLATSALKNGHTKLAFFHFSYKDSVEKLMNQLKKNFSESENICFTLVGANLTNVFLPSSDKSLTFRIWDPKTQGDIFLKNAEARQKVNYFIKETNDCFSLCHIDVEQQKEFDKILELSKIYNKDALKYDLKMLDQELREKKFLAKGFHSACEFEIEGVEDLVAYKNYSTLIEKIKRSFPKENTYIKHTFSTPGNTIAMRFDGTFTEFEDSSLIYPTVKHPALRVINEQDEENISNVISSITY